MGGRAGGGARGAGGGAGGGFRDVHNTALAPAGKGSTFSIEKGQTMTNWSEFTSGKKGVTPQYVEKYKVYTKQNPNGWGIQNFQFDTAAQANAFIAHAASKGYKWAGYGKKTF